MKKNISTTKAPQAIGTYSQAIQAGNTIYLSGQIPLDPRTMSLITDNFEQQIEQVFKNLKAVCQSAGASLDDIVKLNIYLLDFKNYDLLNQVMAKFFSEPYPARTVVAVSQLPKDAPLEIEGVLVKQG